MKEDLASAKYGEHASNLGAMIADSIAKSLGKPAFIADPVVVDELDAVARITGNKLFTRKSIFHALNQKAVAKRYANEVGKNYNELNLIIAHLGGGISVGLHKMGRVVDVNNALDGEGPFSPERSGTLPAGDLAKLCFSGKYTLNDIKKIIKGNGGMVSYRNTNDLRDVRKDVENGDEESTLYFDAMTYQVSKEIGALAAAAEGKIDAIILTGGIANNELFTTAVKNRVAWIADFIVYPGEDEITALYDAAVAVLDGKEMAQKYE